MPIIKSVNAPSSLSPFSMRDIEQQARAMLEKAQRQVDALLLAAQEEADRMRAEAREQGFVDGKAEGIATGVEQGIAQGIKQTIADQQPRIAQLLESLTKATTEIDATRHLLDASAGADVLRLAVSIARRATKKMGMFDESIVTENLNEAIRLVVGAADLRIAVHPSQRKTLELALPEIGMRWPELKHVELVDDATLAPGGCRVHTRQGLIDADLDMQVDRIAADLLPGAA